MMCEMHFCKSSFVYSRLVTMKPEGRNHDGIMSWGVLLESNCYRRKVVGGKLSFFQYVRFASSRKYYPNPILTKVGQSVGYNALIYYLPTLSKVGTRL